MKKTKNKFSILPYLERQKFSILTYIILSVIVYTCLVVSTYIVAKFLDYIVVQDFENGIRAFIYYALCTILARVGAYFVDIYFFRITTKFQVEVKNDLLNKCLDLDSRSFGLMPSGKLQGRVNGDPETISNSLDSIVDSLARFVSGIVILIIVAIYNIYIALTLVFTFGILLIIERWRQKHWVKSSEQFNKARDNFYTFTNEVIRSEKDIKSLNMQKALVVKIDDNLANYKEKLLYKFIKNSKIRNFRDLILDFAVLSILLVCVYMIKGASLTISAFIFVMMNKGSIHAMVWSLGSIAENFNSCRVAIKRIGAVLSNEKLKSETFGDKELANVKGEIEFKNVDFYYTEVDILDEEEKKENRKKRKNKKQEPKTKQEPEVTRVLSNFSIKIPANKTVALVGRSGCGKSTILNLIPKLYSVCGGEVDIDGVNVEDLSKESLRANICLVNQFPYIFDASIKENLLYVKPNASENEIIEVMKKADMGFVNDLPKGINTVVGESGVKLSGGQRQRLAIARALLKNSKIILFDESTSSLDNFSQNAIKESINALSNNNTVVIVAHRLSTIKNADIIFFLNEGKVEAQGTFEELFEKSEKFQQLFVAENI